MQKGYIPPEAKDQQVRVHTKRNQHSRVDEDNKSAMYQAQPPQYQQSFTNQSFQQQGSWQQQVNQVAIPIHVSKRSKLLFVSGLLGVAYAIYIISYIFRTGNQITSSDTAAAIGTSLGMMLITPHLIFTCLAVLFNVIAWAMRLRWASLVAGILYSVAAILMLIYAPFVAIQLILCFVAYAKMK